MAQTVKYQHRNVRSASLSPSMADLGWAAGFLEGEGSFGGNFHKQYPCQVVRATQKDTEPLQKLIALLGGTITLRRSDGYSEWRASGVRARGIMFTLFPFLSARRRMQIKLALGA